MSKKNLKGTQSTHAQCLLHLEFRHLFIAGFIRWGLANGHPYHIWFSKMTELSEQLQDENEMEIFNQIYTDHVIDIVPEISKHYQSVVEALSELINDVITAFQNSIPGKVNVFQNMMLSESETMRITSILSSKASSFNQSLLGLANQQKIVDKYFEKYYQEYQSRKEGPNSEDVMGLALSFAKGAIFGVPGVLMEVASGYQKNQNEKAHEATYRKENQRFFECIDRTKSHFDDFISEAESYFFSNIEKSFVHFNEVFNHLSSSGGDVAILENSLRGYFDDEESMDLLRCVWDYNFQDAPETVISPEIRSYYESLITTSFNQYKGEKKEEAA